MTPSVGIHVMLMCHGLVLCSLLWLCIIELCLFQALRALEGSQVRASPRPQEEPRLQELSGSSPHCLSYFIVYSIRGINEISPPEHWCWMYSLTTGSQAKEMHVEIRC